MKGLKKMMLLLMTVSLVTLTGCSSDDDAIMLPAGGGNNATGGTEYVTADIDGNGWEASQSPAVIVGAQATNGILAVQGGDNAGNTINMSIANYNGVGTYTTGDSVSNTNSIQYLEISPVGSWGSNLASAALGTLMAGTIEVTMDDGTSVEGTFSFEGYNASDMTTKVISNGTFKATLE